MSARVSRSIRLTFLSEATSVLAAVWVTRRIATSYPAEVATYLVLRQILNWFISVGFWGLNISLPRALASAHRPEIRRRVVLAGLVLTLPMVVGITVVGLFAPRVASMLVLHDASADRVFVAAAFLFACNGLFALGAASLQGLDRFGLLAIGRIFAFGVGPVAVMAGLSKQASLSTVLWAWGAATLLVDTAVALPLLSALRLPAAAQAATERLRVTVARLISYGGRRMLGSLSQLSILALAPSLALWAGASSGAAGALSMAAMFGVLSVPLSIAIRQVSLTRLAQPLPREEHRRLAQDVFAATACMCAVMVGVLAASADRLTEVWLGPQFSGYSTLVRLAVVPVGLQYICYTLEGAIDAEDPEHQRPRTQFLASLLFFAGAGLAVIFHAGWPGIVAAQLVPSVVQVVLYTRLMARRYGLPPARELIHGALTVGLGAFLVGLPLRMGGQGLRGTALLSVGQLLVVLALLWMAWAAGVRWPSLVLGERARRAVAPIRPSRQRGQVPAEERLEP